MHILGSFTVAGHCISPPPAPFMAKCMFSAHLQNFELFSSVDSRLCCGVHHAFAPCGAVGDESDGQIPRISINEGAISHENMYV